MKKNDDAPPESWSQPSPRAAMLEEVQALEGAERAKRLSIPYNKPRHIDDEVIVTLMLEARRRGDSPEANTFASVLLLRVTKQVRAHVRKNPGWPRLGGGDKAATDDFCQDVVVAILEDKDAPCHAEVAFGNYVYRRCLDQAGKLYAKKHSAGESLDDDFVEVSAQGGDPVDLPAHNKSPEELLIELEGEWEKQGKLENIREIVQGDFLPELPKNAFTFRFYGGMKIESKKDGEVTISRLMGVSEKTATKYINQAIELIIQRLEQ